MRDAVTIFFLIPISGTIDGESWPATWAAVRFPVGSGAEEHSSPLPGRGLRAVGEKQQQAIKKKL